MIGGFVLVAALIFIFASGAGFEKKYMQFEAAELRYEETAYKPGAEENQVREEVNRLLSQDIQVEMSSESRIDLARQGMIRLNEIEEKIDNIYTMCDTESQL